MLGHYYLFKSRTGRNKLRRFRNAMFTSNPSAGGTNSDKPIVGFAILIAKGWDVAEKFDVVKLDRA